MLALSDKVICMSRTAAAQFDGLAAPNKVSVIFDGLDVSYLGAKLPTETARARWGIPLSASVIGTMGYLNPRKGADCLVEAYAQLRGSIHNGRLLLAGEPFPGYEGFYQKLKDRVRELGLEQEVIFTGFVRDRETFFSALDVFALPTREPEGFGMVIAEALAFGVPVVATRLGGVIEIVEHGASGLLVSPDSPDETARSILSLLQSADLRDRLVAGGDRKIRTHFDIRVAISSLEEIYSTLAECRS